MKILLSYISGATNREDPYLNLLPSGLCYLQATLREAGFDAILINFSGCSDAQIMRRLHDVKPDIVGISQWTHNRHHSLNLAQLIRTNFPHCTIIMGGGHATFCYSDILGADSPVDIVVRGEGEATLLEIVSRICDGREWKSVHGIAYFNAGEVVVTPPRDALSDLDLVPFQARYLEHSIGVDQPLQAEFILTSRGCPSACRFCSSPDFWNRKVRFRSPINIADEIRYIRNRFGLIYFSIRDDTFTADRRRTIDFCKLLIERKAYILWNCQSRVNTLDKELLYWMKQAGCECIQIGVESGSPRILDMLGKTITPKQVEDAAAMVHECGINLSVYLISDVPGETEADTQKTIDLIRRIRPDDGYVSPLAYFPGTRFFVDSCDTGAIDGAIFAHAPESAVYAAGKPGKNSRRLLKVLEASAPDRTSGYYRWYKGDTGYCYTANILEGELLLQVGDRNGAERAFVEITEQEPGNPWGWFLLGELYREQGDVSTAQRCYQRTLEIVPAHEPARRAIKAKKSGTN